ncbi:V-type ATPase subunit [Sulfurisphaera javensis]|uniref:V-type ATPase subunit n=1 Tax=Sulfurisphaera javensis TaxID=2049879 RepID=A0AAT9GS07_9CREN
MSSTLAYSTSIARLYKSFVLTKGTVNELLTTAEWKDALSLLKDRGFIEEIPSTIDDAERKFKQRAINFLTKIRKYVSNTKVNSDIVDLYLYLFSLSELEPLISSLLTGAKLTNNFILIKELADSNPQSLDDVMNFSKGIINEGLKFALSRANKKTPSEINSLLEFYFIYKLSKIVNEFRGDWKSKAQDIICTYEDYYSTALAYKLHLIGDVMCKMDEASLKDIAGANTEKEVLDVLSRTPYSKSLITTNVYEALASFHHLARVNARKSSIEAFMGSPFTPATVLAISELIKLDYEDLTMIINGIKLGIIDKVKKMLSFELI